MKQLNRYIINKLPTKTNKQANDRTTPPPFKTPPDYSVQIQNWNPTFICVWEIVARFARTSSLRIFLTTNQFLSYNYYNKTGLDNVFSLISVVAKQIIGSKSRNKLANKSSLTVLNISYIRHLHVTDILVPPNIFLFAFQDLNQVFLHFGNDV